MLLSERERLLPRLIQVWSLGLFDVAYKQLGPLPFIAEDLEQLLLCNPEHIPSQTGFLVRCYPVLLMGLAQVFLLHQLSLLYSGTHDRNNVRFCKLVLQVAR